MWERRWPPKGPLYPVSCNQASSSDPWQLPSCREQVANEGPVSLPSSISIAVGRTKRSENGTHTVKEAVMAVLQSCHAPFRVSLLRLTSRPLSKIDQLLDEHAAVCAGTCQTSNPAAPFHGTPWPKYYAGHSCQWGLGHICVAEPSAPRPCFGIRAAAEGQRGLVTSALLLPCLS